MAPRGHSNHSHALSVTMTTGTETKDATLSSAWDALGIVILTKLFTDLKFDEEAK